MIEVLKNQDTATGFLDAPHVPFICADFLDESGESVELVVFDESRKNDGMRFGYLTPSDVELNQDDLAVAPVFPVQKASKRATVHTKYDLIKTLMMRYLDQTNGKGDFNGCIEFLLEDTEVDQGAEGKILWTSYNGKLQKAKRKTMLNRLSNYKKEWRQLNQ